MEWGPLVTLIWLSLSTCRLIQLIRTSEKNQFGNYVLVIPQQPTASFSWGKYIVISAADYSQQSEEILLHEIDAFTKSSYFGLIVYADITCLFIGLILSFGY